MNRSDRAVQLFKQGFNCSQSVLCAFAEDFGLDFETAARLASPFGGGIGRMRDVCGAVSGALMALGLKRGYSVAGDINSKSELYKTVQDFADKFRHENGSIYCRELLGLKKACPNDPVPTPRTERFYKSRPCAELVRSAAELLEQLV